MDIRTSLLMLFIGIFGIAFGFVLGKQEGRKQAWSDIANMTVTLSGGSSQSQCFAGGLHWNARLDGTCHSDDAPKALMP